MLPANAQSLQDELQRLFARPQATTAGEAIAFCSDQEEGEVSQQEAGSEEVTRTSFSNIQQTGLRHGYHHQGGYVGGSSVPGGYGHGCSDQGCVEGCDIGCELSTDCYVEPCYIDPWVHRDGVWGSFLYLHAVGADMHYAQQQNGTGGAGTVPFGQIGATDPGFEPGFRVGASLANGACSSLAVAYTYYDSDSVSTIDAPAIVNGTVGSLVFHPGPAVTSSAGPAYADYTIQFQTADVEYRRLFLASSRGWANYSVGARYGRLEQDFFTQGVYAGAQGGDIRTNTDIRFDGGGLRLGLDGERRFGCGGLSCYGNGSFNALVGSFKGDYLMHNATSVTDLAIVDWADDRIAPMLEYEVGVAWTNCNGRWRVSAGYTAIHWFNAVTTPEFIDAVQADNYTDIGDTLTFHGLTSKVEFRY